MSDRGSCPSCGMEVPFKKDGNLWKHGGPDGVPCDNITPDEPRGDENPPEETPVEETKAEVADEDSYYTHRIRSKKPCILQEDLRWHQSNKNLVMNRAQKEGHNPLGQVELVDTEDSAQEIVFVYRVKV